jgi:outer membrane protein
MFFFILYFIRQVSAISTLLPTGPVIQVQGVQQSQDPVTAFPNSPKAPPPRVKDIAVPAAPVTPGSASSQEPQTNAPLTAREAVRIALHQQPSLGVQTGAIQIQQGRTRQTGVLEHPLVNLGAGFDQVQSLSGLGNNVGSSSGTPVQAPNVVLPVGASAVNLISTGADVKQLIFDFNMTRNLVKQSEALERSALHSLTIAQQDLALGVKTAFFNFESAVRSVGVNEGNVANRQRQLDLANARLVNGVGEPSDVATAQTSKSQGILQLNQARDAVEQDRITLLQQMGVDPLTPIVATNEAAPDTADTDAHALTSKAIKQRPEVKAAIEALAAAKYGLTAAKAVDMPAIYAEIGAGFNGSGFPLTDNSANLSVGLQFPIFDGGNRSGAVRVSNGQITTANANLKSAVLQVRTDVASAFMGLKSATQRVAIADNEVFNATEDVRVAEGRYSAGIGLFQDITTAQALLLSSQTDQESAKNYLDLARTQLNRATGELLSDFQ